jgi:hypothetical protein
MEYDLSWPTETVPDTSEEYFVWQDHNVNRIMDFHGDPSNAAISVFSDGNHHMALQESIQRFSDQFLSGRGVFYLTLPPNVINPIIQQGGIQLANLRLTVSPDVIIGPRQFVGSHHEQNKCAEPAPFAYSLGNSFIFSRDSNRPFSKVSDLFHENLKLFISNPEREKASFDVYWNTLKAMVKSEGASEEQVKQWFDLGSSRWVIGQYVHHREAPKAVVEGTADCSLVYHHLALRYSRIFEEIVCVPGFGSGTTEVAKEQEQTQYYISQWGDSGEDARQFVAFMSSDEVNEIYRSHGLQGGKI